MSRAIITSSTDQSIRVWAYNSSGAAITGEAYNSAGIAVSVVVRSAGRIVNTTALTLVARSTVGEHRDKAFTEVGAGEYVVDLEDSYFTTANRQVSVTLTSTAISGGYVLSETLDVGVRVELDSDRSQTLSDLRAMITGSGTADAKFDAVALSLAPSGGGLTGPYTRTILITDADTDEGIEGAQVRLYRPGESESKQTVDGNEVEFTLAAATWTYAVTANGYQGRSGSIVVTGDGETTIELTPLSITPGDVGQTTGWLITRVRGAATADITIRYQQVQEPDSDTGSSYDTTIYQAVSDAEGLAELTLIPGGRYYIWRGLIKKPESTPIITIPANAGSTYELPSHVGK